MDARTLSPVTDNDRLYFMLALCEQTRAKNGLMFSDWEQQFISSFRGASRKILWFTAGRRDAVDKLRMKYGGEPEIAMPWPTEETSLAERNRVPKPAPAGKCGYIKRDEDRRQVRCNEPAAFRAASGLQYCRACAEIAIEACKKAKQHLHLRLI